ncbi:MAG TPA: hypothetical protein VFJ71_13915, partial [Candidatus Limnocylindrales bacterium]|nr:hypothetical protein [Candidatus Limnocylindrales bacterium]
GLLTSSQRPTGNGGGGSSPGVAVASTSGASIPEVALGPTPIPIPKKNVEYVARDAAGNLKVNVKTVDEVCPKGATEPCDTSAPVEERSVTIDQDAEAIYGSQDQARLIVVSPASSDNPGTVAVVALSDEPVAPSATPSEPAASDSPIPPSETPGPTPTPSTPPSSAPPSPPATASPSPTVSETPTGSIDVTPPGSGATITIARGVELVGQTAAYSRSGSWFAFTARPIDGSAGPDVYVWHVGTAEAHKVTHDGRSMFGSWSDDQIVGSSAVDATSGAAKGAASIVPQAFVLDPASAARVALPQVGSVWRPAVAPGDHRWAVYWTGTLRPIDGPGYAPEAGRLVLGDWSGTEPGASGAPAATPLTGDQTKERHEITIGFGRVDDWTAAWDPSGTRLAVWIADHQNPAIGRLSLYAVRQFDGSIDLKAPLLESRIALAGFAISDGELIWAQPSRDGSAAKATLQLLAWTDDGIGTVQTYEGSALVIR